MDQRKATLLLEQRKRGYSVWLAMRSMAKRYVLILACSVPWVLLAVHHHPAHGWLWAMPGFGLGLIVRDISWLMGVKKSWSQTMATADWGKIEAIARGDSGPQPTEEVRR